MNRITPVTFTMIALFLGSCEDRSVIEESSESIVESQSSSIPETFSAALDALDEMATEDTKQSYRNDESHMGLVHRQVGMQLRNDWGLWGGSKLKDYFSSRGIAHADWISSAILDGWIERLKTGSFDEDRIIAEYAKIEKEWRERPTIPESDSEEGIDPFAPEPAEHDIAPDR